MWKWRPQRTSNLAGNSFHFMQLQDAGNFLPMTLLTGGSFYPHSPLINLELPAFVESNSQM